MTGSAAALLTGLLGTAIDLDRSTCLYDAPFTAATLERDFEVASGQWSVTPDGWLEGSLLADAGGFVYSRWNHPGDILMDFTAQLVPPCTHDLNFAWCAEGWDAAGNDAGRCYIGGLSGWYDGKSGIERYPETRVQAMTSLLSLVPGRDYRIQAGTVGERCFLFVDGRLVLDLRDPDPLSDPACGRIGFGVYHSAARYRDLRAYRPFPVAVAARYTGLDSVERR